MSETESVLDSVLEREREREREGGREREFVCVHMCMSGV